MNKTLQHNLLQAQQRMKKYADAKRMQRELSVPSKLVILFISRCNPTEKIPLVHEMLSSWPANGMAPFV
jgi:hypothetical protein